MSTNPLADSIRQINDWRIPDDLRDYVTRLADGVQRIGDQPTTGAPFDFTNYGMNTEQEIRARATEILLAGRQLLEVRHLLDQVETLAAYITDGSKPA